MNPFKRVSPVEKPRTDTGYSADTIYKSRSGTRYRAVNGGTLKRMDGPKITKAERKAEKRAAVRERRRESQGMKDGRGAVPRQAHNLEVVGSNPTRPTIPAPGTAGRT